MNADLSLNHSRWVCKYHVVWIPKYRKKALHGQLRKFLGQVSIVLADENIDEALAVEGQG